MSPLLYRNENQRKNPPWKIQRIQITKDWTQMWNVPIII